MRSRALCGARAGLLSCTFAILVGLTSACGDDTGPGETGSGGSGGAGASTSTEASSGSTTGATSTASTGGEGGAGVGGQGGSAGGGEGGATERQLDQIATLEEYVDTTADETGWSVSIDRDALKGAGRDEILGGDGSDAVFFQAMHHAHLGLPQGHQSLSPESFEDCNNPAMFLQGWTRFGVCGRPRGDEIVVMVSTDDNVLGLQAGDSIVRADDDEGPALLEAAIDRPVCGSLAVSDSGLRTNAAASFFGTIREGMTLEVRSPTGETREVVVPPGGTDYYDCQDPFGGDIAFNASSYVRDDGVAVLRLPRFYPIDATLPPNPTNAEVEQFIDDFRDSILVAFDAIRDEPYLVIDARSNYGGITLIGLEIAGGMPTAQPTDVSYCTGRVAGTEPPEFEDQYAEYGVEPGGPFAYDGEVVVLIDGLDYSAADYFPYAIHKATSTPLVGTASAGAYGGPGPLRPLDGPPAMQFNVDVNNCVDAGSGEPLEGHAETPDLVVEYDPVDLANGVDTVMEAAVALVLGG